MRYLSSTATSLSLILAHGITPGAARRWTDIVTNRQKTPRDRFRFNLLLESDNASATSSTTTPPKYDNDNGNNNDDTDDRKSERESPTHQPTRPPSLRPTPRPTTPRTPAPVSPTESPTPASLCPAGYMPYEVHMYDRFGDGWDGTSLKIAHAFGYEESFRGTLRQGHKAVQGACLSATKCHRVSIEGVSPWNSEIYWEIYAQQADGTLVKVAYGEDVGSVSSIGRNNNGYSTSSGGGCTFDPKGGRSGVLAGCFNTCRDPNDVPVQSNLEYGEAPSGVVPTRKPTGKPTPYIAGIRPNGYFNYNENDLEYGPSAWRDVDTSGNIWEAYTGIDASNQCGTNPSMQSPIILPEQGTSTCRSRRQMRSRSRRFNTCDGESGTFEITPTRLRVQFGRGYEPTVVLPEGNNGIEASYMEVAVPGLHKLTEEDGSVKKYDAEYIIYYPWVNKGRIVAISVLIDAVSGAQDNVMFQQLIDGWSKVTSCSHSFRMDIQRDRRLQGEVEDRDEFEVDILNHSTQQRKLQLCDFDIFHKSLVPSIYYYSYFGTLSEPPCTSNVNWKVIEKPMIISASQLQQMNALLSQGPCKDDEFAQHLKGRGRKTQTDAGRAIEKCNTRNYWLDCNNNCDCSEELCPRDFQGTVR